VSTRSAERLLVVLAFAAGAIDAISFLGLDEVFTANMTGNLVLLGLALGQGEFSALWHSAAALGGFVLGAAAATVIVDTGTSDEGGAVWPRRVTVALALECGLLGAFAIAWASAGPDRSGATAYALIALAGCAMGLQSGAVRSLRVPDVLTVVVTGTLTSLVARLTARARPGRPAPPDAPKTLDIRAAVIAAMALGAVAGGALELHAYDAAALLPLAAACAVAGAASLVRVRTA
jgi:uncharacterized membrane protein YoaK (UPF0700 family)